MKEKFRLMSKQTKIIVAATILCFFVAILMVANSIMFKTKEKITVRATVTQMIEFDESTEDTVDTGYDVYGEYGCMGEYYSDILCARVPLNTEIQVGDKIDVLVYADNPAKTANDTTVNAWFFVAAFGVLAVISFKKFKDDTTQE